MSFIQSYSCRWVKSRCSTLAVSIALVTLCLGRAFAQPSPEGEGANEQSRERGRILEEVIVTAQKRAESLDKVPIAISAFDQQSMEKLGGASLSENITLVPNMQNGSGGLTIRGIGTTSITSTAPTVAIHVDGVYTDGDPRGLAQNVDVERVEVLRGPQGTLYGRNATAGVVNIISAKPGPEFELFGDVEYGSDNEQVYRVTANLPIAERLAARISARRAHDDGWQENTVSGEHNGDAEDTTLVRLGLGWQPLDALSWDIHYEYKRDQSVKGSFQEDWYVSKPDRETAIVYPSGLPEDEVPPFGPNVQMFGPYEDRNGEDSTSHTIRTRLEYEINENYSLAWIGAFEDFESQGNSEPFGVVVVGRSLRNNDLKATSELISQELNFNFDVDWGRGVAGLYYWRKESEDASVQHIWLPTGSSGPDSPPELSPTASIANESLEPSFSISRAAFGQATYDFSDALRLTAGLRYSEDTADAGRGRRAICLFGEFNGTLQPSSTCQMIAALGIVPGLGESEIPAAKEEWNELSWKLTLDRDFSANLLGYATVSTGYKQGAITGRDASGIKTVEPETNTNYELGGRARLLDDRLKLNLTLFWMDYVDLQVNTAEVVGGAPQPVLTNVGEALSRGVELEYVWQITPLDRIDGYVTYLDAKIEKWPNAPDNLRGSAFMFDAAGQELPNSPEYTFRIAYSHIFDLGAWGELTPTIATYYSDDFFIQHTNGPQDYNDSYWRSDVFLRYSTLAERFTLEAFVNNIEDEHIKRSSFAFLTEASDTSPGGGIQWNSYAPGRTMGIRAGFRF